MCCISFWLLAVRIQCTSSVNLLCSAVVCTACRQFIQALKEFLAPGDKGKQCLAIRGDMRGTIASPAMVVLQYVLSVSLIEPFVSGCVELQLSAVLCELLCGQAVRLAVRFSIGQNTQLTIDQIWKLAVIGLSLKTVAIYPRSHPGIIMLVLIVLQLCFLVQKTLHYATLWPDLLSSCSHAIPRHRFRLIKRQQLTNLWPISCPSGRDFDGS